MATIHGLKKQQGREGQASSALAPPRRAWRRLSRVCVFVAIPLLAAAGGWHFGPAERPASPVALFVPEPAPRPARREQARPAAVDRHFSLCGGGRRNNCVVDGDTFWLAGEKIRIADINTPEVSSPQCAAEARLGKRATSRLQALLNAGPFEVRGGARDEDVYGRKLRTLHRDGRSIGGVMVSEGLAHPWRGRKESWCG